MTIEERANAYIGHPFEVDEGLEITMARTAYEVGATDQREIDEAEMLKVANQAYLDGRREKEEDMRIMLESQKIALIDKACAVARSMGFDGVADQIRKAMED